MQRRGSDRVVRADAERSSPVQLVEATFTLRNNCLQPSQNRIVSVRDTAKTGTRTMMDSHGCLLAKAVARALVAAVAVGSLVVLLDAGAKYSELAWRAANVTREPSDLEREVSVPGFTPLEFRLSANLPLERERPPCSGAPHRVPESPDGDGSFDIGCRGATVKAVGDLPRPELVSWSGDWLYHRGLHF